MRRKHRCLVQFKFLQFKPQQQCFGIHLGADQSGKSGRKHLLFHLQARCQHKMQLRWPAKSCLGRQSPTSCTSALKASISSRVQRTLRISFPARCAIADRCACLSTALRCCRPSSLRAMAATRSSFRLLVDCGETREKTTIGGRRSVRSSVPCGGQADKSCCCHPVVVVSGATQFLSHQHFPSAPAGSSCCGRCYDNTRHPMHNKQRTSCPISAFSGLPSRSCGY